MKKDVIYSAPTAELIYLSSSKDILASSAEGEDDPYTKDY